MATRKNIAKVSLGLTEHAYQRAGQRLISLHDIDSVISGSSLYCVGIAFSSFAK